MPTKNKDFHSLRQCYRYIKENTHEGIWMVDVMGITTYVNERIAWMLGTRVEDIKDKTAFDFFFEEDYEAAFQVSARCSSRIKEELDFRLRKIDGTELWAHITIAPIEDKKGNFKGSIGLLTDITETRKIQQALNESEEQYRIFFNQELVGAVEVAPFSGKILAANNRACEIFGYTNEEITQITIFELTYIDDQHKHLEDYSRLSSAEIPSYTTEKRYVKKDGSVIWANVTIGMVNNSKGIPLHTAAIIVDITESKLLQRKLLKRTEIRQKSLTKAIIKGQEKERQLIGQELHDNINQVLAVIKLYNEASLTDEEGRERFIQKSIKYLNDCMKEIRKISKSLVIPNFDAISLVDSVNDLISSINSTNKLNIILTDGINDAILGEEITIAAYRVIQEHLSNVLKHAEASEIKITITMLKDILSIEIVDNGKGFNFNKKRKGIGITNMISRVDAVNGQIEFKTEKGKGCTMIVKFFINISIG